jgi:hypothetical protein
VEMQATSMTASAKRAADVRMDCFMAPPKERHLDPAIMVLLRPVFKSIK